MNPLTLTWNWNPDHPDLETYQIWLNVTSEVPFSVCCSQCWCCDFFQTFGTGTWPTIMIPQSNITWYLHGNTMALIPLLDLNVDQIYPLICAAHQTSNHLQWKHCSSRCCTGTHPTISVSLMFCWLVIVSPQPWPNPPSDMIIWIWWICFDDSWLPSTGGLSYLYVVVIRVVYCDKMISSTIGKKISTCKNQYLNPNTYIIKDSYPFKVLRGPQSVFVFIIHIFLMSKIQRHLGFQCVCYSLGQFGVSGVYNFNIIWL